ncbi:unnamed protein product [Musa banksii]
MGDKEGAELEEVAEHGGAAGAALEPDEERGLRNWGERLLGLVEGVEERRRGWRRSGADGEVARLRRAGFFREERSRRGGGEEREEQEEDGGDGRLHVDEG